MASYLFETESDFIERILAYFPNASVGNDNDGQIIIYTGLCYNDSAELTMMEEG